MKYASALLVALFFFCGIAQCRADDAPVRFTPPAKWIPGDDDTKSMPQGPVGAWLSPVENAKFRQNITVRLHRTSQDFPIDYSATRALAGLKKNHPDVKVSVRRPNPKCAAGTSEVIEYSWQDAELNESFEFVMTRIAGGIAVANYARLTSDKADQAAKNAVEATCPA